MCLRYAWKIPIELLKQINSENWRPYFGIDTISCNNFKCIVSTRKRTCTHFKSKVNTDRLAANVMQKPIFKHTLWFSEIEGFSWYHTNFAGMIKSSNLFQLNLSSCAIPERTLLCCSYKQAVFWKSFSFINFTKFHLKSSFQWTGNITQRYWTSNIKRCKDTNCEKFMLSAAGISNNATT